MSTRREDEVKLFQSLKTLKELLYYKDNISISTFFKQKNVKYYNQIPMTMVKKGIISKQGNIKKWNTVEPTLEMAIALLDVVREEMSTKNALYQKAGKKKRPNTTTKSNAEKPKFNETANIENQSRLVRSEKSILFGLIKVKTKYYYN
jgi:hypothetical protein